MTYRPPLPNSRWSPWTFVPGGEVRLFTLIATIGAPLEVTAASLAIETFLPADAAGAARLRELAGLG
jgi:hypothetical protein